MIEVVFVLGGIQNETNPVIDPFGPSRHHEPQDHQITTMMNPAPVG